MKTITEDDLFGAKNLGNPSRRELKKLGSVSKVCMDCNSLDTFGCYFESCS